MSAVRGLATVPARRCGAPRGLNDGPRSAYAAAMRSTLARVVAWFAIPGWAACGGGSSPPRPDAPPADPPAVSVFDPFAAGAGGPWGAIPYPSDLYLDAAGRLALTTLPVGADATPEDVQSVLEGLATFDGAGLRGNVYLPIRTDPGVDLDAASLAGAAALVDLDASSAGDVVTLPVDALWRADLDAVVLVPARGTVFLPGRRYAAYLTSAATADGVGIGADPDLRAAIAPGATGPAAASLAPLVAVLPSSTTEALVSATVFRTVTLPEETRRMRDVVAALPPTVSELTVHAGNDALDAFMGVQDDAAIPGVCATSGRPQPNGRVAALVHGTIGLASFLSATPGVDGFPEFAADGTPQVKGTHPVRFTLTLPVAASWEDLPVVLYVHGINRTRQDLLSQVDTAAKLGAAMLAIDLPYHGDRATRTPPQDVRNELLGTNTPDGFGDTNGLLPATQLFHLADSGGIRGLHPRAMGENLRQAAVELAQVVAWVRDGDLAPLAAALAAAPGAPGPVSFRDDVGLLTESLGAMVSGVTLALEPNVVAAYLSSPAAGFPEPAMLHSPNFAGIFAGAITGPFDVAGRIDETDPARDFRIDPLVMLYTNVIERGDALAYAPLVVPGTLRGGAGPDLVVTMAWGDVWVSNDTTEAYARALGLPFAPMAGASPPTAPVRFVELATAAWPLAGNLPGGRTGGFVVFDPAGHAAFRKYEELRNFEPLFPPYVERNPPEVIFPTQTAQHQELWSELMAARFAGGAVALTDPYADVDPETGGTACP